MNKWDAKWLERMDENLLEVLTGVRYMDDICAFMTAIKAGWRWHEGQLCYCEAWRLEDLESGLSSTARTAKVVADIMNSIMEFLRFNIEICDDFPVLKLPTLDTKIWGTNGKI